MSSPISTAQPIVYVPAPSLVDVKNGNAVLQKGHKGDAVSYVQDLLKIPVDRRFGKDTETAVREFQQRSAASVDPGMEGKVDRALLAAIEAAGGVEAEGLFDYDQRHKLASVYPALRERVRQLAQRLAARQMSFLITDGLRTVAEQDQLYRKGRKLVNGTWMPIDPVNRIGIVTNSPGGFSNHNYGLAIDSYPVISGRVYTEIPRKASVEFRKRFTAIQTAIGEEGEAAGLFWGGRWTNPYDPPHLQLFSQTEMKPKKCLEIFRANGNSLAAVWHEVDNRLS
jgi:D-alanyl-D-alanine carboxypeptidase/Putative peptidoglycan binding domain